MIISTLPEDEKIALYEKVKKKYPWASKPKNIARLAEIEYKRQ